MDSLDGWVAIRSDLFQDTGRYKMGFLVQWSEMEGAFAVICHNRTLQQKKSRGAPGEGPGDEPWLGDTSWAGMFTGSELKHIHQQLSGCADLLTPYLPDLSGFTEPGLLGALLFGRTDRLEHQVEMVCVHLERYFSTALDVCGATILLDVVYGQQQRGQGEGKGQGEGQGEGKGQGKGQGEGQGYCEDLLEFRRRAMEEQLQRTKQDVLKVRDTPETVEPHKALPG